MALVLSMKQEFLPFIQKIICAIQNIQHEKSKEYLDKNLNIGTEIKVPTFSDDMKSISFEAYKIIGKTISVTKHRNQKSLKQLLAKAFLQIARKNVRFSIFEQPFNFCFFIIVLLLLYTLYYFG